MLIVFFYICLIFYKNILFIDIKIDNFNGVVISNKIDKSVDGENKKERSVLQAKLTKLAIQIGYIGYYKKFKFKFII